MSLRGRKTPILVVAVAAMVLFMADWGAERAGGSTFPGGPLDEIAHALTVALALWAVGMAGAKSVLDRRARGLGTH